MADTSFIFHSDWLDSIQGLTIDEQDKVIGEIVRYGVGLEPAHEEATVVALVKMVMGRIDFSKEKYEAKKGGGSKKKVDDREIYELARQGKSSKEIAEILGVSKSAVDHSEGWRNRRLEF